MAVAMAALGGMGFVHYNSTVRARSPNLLPSDLLASSPPLLS